MPLTRRPVPSPLPPDASRAAPSRAGPGAPQRPAPPASCSSTARWVRFVAGADEAGRGCLAGPLVAAAVLFDVEALGVREVRALTALNDSKQHDARGARGAVPDRPADRRKVGGRLALRARDRRLRPARHEPRGAARRAARVARPGCLCLIDGFRGAATSATSSAPSSTATHERGDRRRLDPRQGHARPLHAPRRRAASGLGLRAPTSATRRPSTATRSAPGRLAAAPHVVPVTAYQQLAL